MRLYSFWRSTATYRVRIALNLKGLPYEIVPLHLLREGGGQHTPAYRKINPQGRIPTLELDDGTILAQSMAILEYLEETHPTPPLLPNDSVGRAKVRRVALMVVADIHPLGSTSVQAYLRGPDGMDAARIETWNRHWLGVGLAAVEQLIEAAPYCFGRHPTFADICLVAQVYNAQRFKVDLSPFPKISTVVDHCGAIDAFARAAPAVQPDAEI